MCASYFMQEFFLTVFEPVLIFLYARSLNKMLNLKKRAPGSISFGTEYIPAY